MMNPSAQLCRSVLAGALVFCLGASAWAQSLADHAKTLAEHPQVARRTEAARTLGDAVPGGSEPALAALGKALEGDPSPEVRAAAAAALGRAKSCTPALGAWLARGRGDPSSFVRAAAEDGARKAGCAIDLLMVGSAGTPSPQPAAPTPAPTAAPTAAKERAATDAVLRSHLVYGSTAHAIPQGTASWNIANLGAWEFGYALRDDLHLSLLTGPPIGYIAFRPQLRYSFGSDLVRGAVLVEGGTVIPYLSRADDTVGVLGGGAIVTVGGTRNFFSAGAYGYAGFGRNSTVGAILLTLGGQIEVSERLRIAVEGWLPFIPQNRNAVEAGLLFYGLKIVGGRLYGNIGFAYIFASEVYGLYKYLPLGIPLLQFGFTW